MGLIYSITTEAEEAIAAATEETLLQLRGATNAKAKLLEWGVSFDGTTVTNSPVRVRLARMTTDGTATGATEVPWDPDDPATAKLTGFHSFTAMPTIGDVLEDHEIHPQGGIFKQYPLGREPTIDAAATSRLGITVNAPEAVNAVGYMVWEE